MHRGIRGGGAYVGKKGSGSTCESEREIGAEISDSGTLAGSKGWRRRRTAYQDRVASRTSSVRVQPSLTPASPIIWCSCARAVAYPRD